MSAEPIEELATGHTLVEGPVWDERRGLIFSDVHAGGAYALDPATKTVTEVIAHRRGMGGLALHAADGLVVSGRNISFKPDGGGATVVLLAGDDATARVGFNDITTDAVGRVYAGSLAASPFDAPAGDAALAGALHLIDLDGSARIVAEDVRLTNGLGFSPDGRTLYHSDTLRGALFCYAVEPNGDLGPKREFAQMPSGAPDGLVVSADGAVWVALAGGGKGVAVFETNGALRDKIEIPLPMCTSVCFGGADLRDLYIVTGSDGAPTENSGTIYRYRSPVAGLPVAPARVALPQPTE
ncbi:MAG: SMP-30/gluconolactonase/LRE family protein [Pseudomonadota bacterium]